MSMRIQRRARPESRTVATPELARLLREGRLEANLSISEVSSYLEITPDTLEGYEEGSRQIPLSHLYGLSNLLNIPPRMILDVSNRSAPLHRKR